MPTPTQSQPPAAGEAAHTPTPWRAIILSRKIEHGKPNQYAYPIKPVGGDFLIASVTLAYPSLNGDPNKLDYAQGEANVAFIVRACNAHALNESLISDLQDQRDTLTAEKVILQEQHAGLVAFAQEAITEPGAMAERSHEYALKRLAAISAAARAALQSAR